MQVSAGERHSIAVDSAGRVWAWGNNEEGQLGQADRMNSATPRRVPGLPDLMPALYAVAIGDHSLAVMLASSRVPEESISGTACKPAWHRSGQQRALPSLTGTGDKQSVLHRYQRPLGKRSGRSSQPIECLPDFGQNCHYSPCTCSSQNKSVSQGCEQVFWHYARALRVGRGTVASRSVSESFATCPHLIFLSALLLTVLLGAQT